MLQTTHFSAKYLCNTTLERQRSRFRRFRGLGAGQQTFGDVSVEHYVGRPFDDNRGPDPAPEPALYQLPDGQYLDVDGHPVAGVTGPREPEALGHEHGTVAGQPGADDAGHQRGQVNAVHQWRQAVAAGMHDVGVAAQPREIDHVRLADALEHGHAVAHGQRPAAAATAASAAEQPLATTKHPRRHRDSTVLTDYARKR